MCVRARIHEYKTYVSSIVRSYRDMVGEARCGKEDSR